MRRILSQHAALFTDGPLVQLAMTIAHLLAEYLPEGLRIDLTTSDTIVAPSRPQAMAQEAGTRSMRHMIPATSRVRTTRGTVLVRGEFLDSDQS